MHTQSLTKSFVFKKDEVEQNSKYEGKKQLLF